MSMKKLEMSCWDIIPAGSEEEVYLPLSFCTGLFAYEMGAMYSGVPIQGAPYLAVHMPPFVPGGVLPMLAMDFALNSPEFSGTSDRKISLREILEAYRERLGEKGRSAPLGT